MRNRIQSDSFNSLYLQRIPVQDKEIVKHLLALYLHELSAYTIEVKQNQQGLFEYEGLEEVWSSNGSYPMYIKLNNEIAGFVIVTAAPHVPTGVDYSILEFFILRAYRKRGVGSAAFEALIRHYPGNYYVAQLRRNEQAILFWKKVYAENRIEYVEVEWLTPKGEPCVAQYFTV